MQYLIGLDIGTTAEKIALFNIEGKMLAVSTQEYTLDTPCVNFVEVPAETYWNAFKEGVKEIRKQYVISETDSCALAISAQGETLLEMNFATKRPGRLVSNPAGQHLKFSG